MSDLISRQAAIEDIRSLKPKDAQLDAKWVEMWVRQLPSAEPEWKTGIWMGSVCSECGSSTPFYYDYDFCPHCGADMRRNDGG